VLAVGDEREAWQAQLGDPEAHARITADLRLLHEVELRRPPASARSGLEGWVRVAAWNLQRGRHPAAMVDLLRRTGADVVLVSEADVGMARTGNVDVPAALAEGLAMGSAFAVEFVELGLGDAAETAAVLADGGGANERGLHGNAVLASVPMTAARPVRIELRGDWFSADRGEPRVGGRVAVVAQVELDGAPLTVASVHLESASDPADRAAQMAVVLDAVDEVAGPDGAAVVGGDCNTFGASFAELADHAALARLRAAEPTRFAWPVAHEPLFEIARGRGFEWVDANVAAPTTEHTADGAPLHHPLKIDWFLTRGLEARRPTVVPALGPDGTVLSDHRLLAVSVRRRRP
jgi:endonuclease/exonuclease/phosphatase family metal-dependent hydrolase